MLSVKAVRWLMGWTEFSITAGTPRSAERFLNLAARQGIGLWDIRRDGDRFSARVGVRRYRNLCAPARKASVRLRAGKRSGFPFFLKRCGRRKGLFVGGALFLAILLVMPLFVWKIDVRGNDKISAGEIRAAAAEYGLVPGLPRRSLDTSDLEQKLMLRFPDIGWISLNTGGCVVTIEIDEKIAKPEVVDEEKYANVTAARGGQIIRLDVYEGEAQVEAGSAVVPGQLLISGVVEDGFGRSTLHHARGMALARTRRAVRISIPMRQTVSTPTGEVVERESVQLLGLSIPISFAEEPEGDFRRETETRTIQMQGIELPVTVFTERWVGIETEEVTLTEEQAQQKAEQEFEKFCQEQWKDIKVVSHTGAGKLNGDVYQLEITCVCEENIAVESEILLN